MNFEYKTITFGCMFSTKATFNKKLENLINENAKEGWRLHTMQVGGLGEFCVCVFEREKN